MAAGEEIDGKISYTAFLCHIAEAPYSPFYFDVVELCTQHARLLDSMFVELRAMVPVFKGSERVRCEANDVLVSVFTSGKESMYS